MRGEASDGLLTGPAGDGGRVLKGSGGGGSALVGGESTRADTGSEPEVESGLAAGDSLPGVSVSMGGADDVLREATPSMSIPLASTTRREALYRACFNSRRWWPHGACAGPSCS